MMLFWRLLALLALVAVSALVGGFAVSVHDDRTKVAPADVLPTPNAWQVLIVPPGDGNFHPVVSLGSTLTAALHAASEDGINYGEFLSPWIAGPRCSFTGVKRTCNAVRNPYRLDASGHKVKR